MSITGVTTTDTTSESSRTVKKGFFSKKVTTTSSSSSTETFNGTSLSAGGNLSVSAGNTLAIKGSDIAAGGNATLIGTNGVQLSSALENSSANSAFKSKKKTTTTAETATTNRLSSITSGGNLTVGSAPASAGAGLGAVSVAGADLSATGTTTLIGQSVSVSGVIDKATFDATSKVKKSGLLSKKVTTTVQSSSTEAVVASTIAGDRVNVVATGARSGENASAGGGDVTVKGSNIVSDNGTLVQATGAITIGTLEAKSSQSQSVKVKKSGISLSGSGLFAGVAKTRNDNSLETVTNTGSLIGAANGDVSVNAGAFGGRSGENASAGALTITGSQVAAPGTVTLSGESVTIQNATNAANSTSLAKSSSFGLSLKAYENVSGAVKSVATLADRVGAGAKGGAAATGITAASETLRSVAAVTSALTNTAGVSANLGVSKSKSRTATQESAGDGTVGSAGVSASLSFSKSNASSAIVETQSALLARGGALSASVAGNTDLKGGVIAALDASGKDSGKLTLSTATLTASDIKDAAKSKSIGIGVSANINKPGEEGVRSADLPVVDGSFASSSFKQDSKATIGQGVLNVGVPDNNVTINRDIDAAQVVTKDKSTGFTLNIDPAAIREVIALAKGDRDNSTILQGVAAIRADLDGNRETASPLATELRDVARDIRLTNALRANNAAQAAGTLSAGERIDRNVELITTTLIEREVEAQLAALPVDQRAGQRAAITEATTERFNAEPIQDAIRLSAADDDLRSAQRTVRSGGALNGAERARVDVAVGLSRPAQPLGPDGDIIVTANLISASDADLLNAGESSIVRRAGQLVRPISEVGGGGISGTGTGLINNARDTFGLVSDVGGFLINRASFGGLYQAQARRTEGRVEAAVTLFTSLRDNPEATLRQVASGYVAPFREGAGQIANGNIFAGTETITEASSDLVLNAIGGGTNFLRRLLTNPRNVDVPNAPDVPAGNVGLGADHP